MSPVASASSLSLEGALAVSFATAFVFVSFWTVIAIGIVVIDQRVPLKLVEIVGATIVGGIAIVAIGIASLI